MVSIRENIESVHELVLSQEGQTGTHRSVSVETTEVITVIKFPFFGHSIENCDF